MIFAGLAFNTNRKGWKQQGALCSAGFEMPYLKLFHATFKSTVINFKSKSMETQLDIHISDWKQVIKNYKWPVYRLLKAVESLQSIKFNLKSIKIFVITLNPIISIMLWTNRSIAGFIEQLAYNHMSPCTSYIILTICGYMSFNHSNIKTEIVILPASNL